MLKRFQLWMVYGSLVLSIAGYALQDTSAHVDGVKGRAVDSSAIQPAVSFSEKDPDAKKLSEYCDADCGSVAANTNEAKPIYCWVPNLGTLAVVPYSATGINVCEARKKLCLNIKAGNPNLKSASRDPDDHAFLCKPNG